MDDDKRKGDEPVPSDADNFLNDDQRAQLRKIESFGWTLKYIRRPLFQKEVVIVSDANGSSIGVLEKDGRLNLESDIETRD